MSQQDHYDEAEKILKNTQSLLDGEDSSFDGTAEGDWHGVMAALALAQVHATLALYPQRVHISSATPR